MSQSHETTPGLVDRLFQGKNKLVALAVEAASLRSSIDHLERSLIREPQVGGEEVSGLYREMGLVLPEVVVRTFDEVIAFHASIAANRRIHLGAGLERSRERLEAVMLEIEEVERLALPD